MTLIAELNKGISFLNTQLHDSIISPLTKISETIYYSEPFSHFKQGFLEIFKVPSFLKIGDATQTLIKTSFQSNVIEYLIPYIMYRRAVNAILLEAPDVLDPFIIAADWLITLSLVSRLYVRQLVNNACYTLALPKVVSNDIARYLPKAISETLSKKLCAEFKNIFLLHHNFNDNEFCEQVLAEKLNEVFLDFFSKKNFTEKSIKSMINPLQIRLSTFVKQQNYLSVSDEFIENFSAAISKVIANEFCRGFFKTYSKTQKEDKLFLESKLNKIFIEKKSEEIARHLINDIASVRNEVQSYLPIVYHASCGCSIKKTIHASISSPIYYTGNLIFISFPDLLNEIFLLSSGAYLVGKTLSFLMKILIYGHNVNEYKVTSEAHCTRHRYQIFARNKAHSFGVGAAQIVAIETISLLLYLTMGVNNFITRDAISNIIIQLASVAALGFNDPLPGKKENPWDVFYLPKQITKKTLHFFNWLFSAEIEDNKSLSYHIKQAEKILFSSKISELINFLLCEGNYYPKDTDFKRVDGFIIATRFQSIQYLMTLFNNDIQRVIITAENFHHYAKLMTGPLLVLPIPGMLASLIVMPLRLLKEESLLNVVKTVQKLLFDLRLKSKIVTVDQSVEQDLLEKRIAETLNPSNEEESKIDSTKLIQRNIGFNETLSNDFCLVDSDLKSVSNKKPKSYSYQTYFFKNVQKTMAKAFLKSNKCEKNSYELKSFK